ncbi:MAG: MarR family transcriptional regulator [Hydrogenophaga sp.]|uniref:MarR family transcriptional regulator n=1 Tax=Hydrogenophaga sp. TaxID=1904254 RepID=UPI001D46B059|nr:MarR family transcriptional regulator [Hydrogenophaga sp.]MBX3610802.1 MarR family transcriptional regulator [Hydrogenophaga sp.]
MSTDIVKELGLLTLGSRLKRLGERLQGQTQVLLDAQGLGVPASHQPLLAALARADALSVGELVQALGVSQPGVTRQLGNLQAAGLVQAWQGGEDLRLRRMRLTEAGRSYVALAEATAWAAIRAAVTDACAGQGEALLGHLDALEQALDAQDLATRQHQTTEGATHAPA